MSDEIRRLSEELARDPSSLVFMQLGEALRRGGQLDLGLRVANRGLELVKRYAHAGVASQFSEPIKLNVRLLFTLGYRLGSCVFHTRANCMTHIPSSRSAAATISCRMNTLVFLFGL